MESDIQYRELSPQTLESKVFLTADDVNELCWRWIEAERKRSQALLGEVVAASQRLRGPPGARAEGF
jgi:hypothetical protein